jgi:hypothetical protein
MRALLLFIFDFLIYSLACCDDAFVVVVVVVVENERDK